MLHLLLVLLPLGLAAAVSPMMTTEQTLLLASPGGRRAAVRFAVGAAGVLAVVVGVVVTVGQSLSLPRAPELDASLDLVVGVALLGLALVVLILQRRHPVRPKPARPPMSAARALGFGAFSMATNVTSLALVVPAAKEIAASGLAIWWSAAAAVLLVTLVCLPAWGPLALTAIAPRGATRLLDRLQRFVSRRGRQLVVPLVAAAGAFFLVRGVLRLLG